MRKRIFLSPPWVGASERGLVGQAFDSGYVAPCGPMVDAFDRRLGELSGQHAAAVASGTAAIDLLMAELGVGSRTTIVTSSLTFIATVGPAVKRGAKVVFVDSDPATGTISIPLLEQALADVRRPAVVVAADIYGQCCDYDSLEEVCARHRVPLVLDAAESVGATYKDRPSGLAGAAAVYSFNGNKIITTSGGGAVLSRDPELVARAKWRAQQAREPVAWYEHREIGYNYRMSNLLAAIGCAQLNRLPEIIRRKRRIFDFYCGLFGISVNHPTTKPPNDPTTKPPNHQTTKPPNHQTTKLPNHQTTKPFPCAAHTRSTRWLSVFLFPSETLRDKVASRLEAANIECRPVWKPLHLQPVFAGDRVYGGEVAEDLFRRGLCMPSGAGLTRADLARIAKAIVG